MLSIRRAARATSCLVAGAVFASITGLAAEPLTGRGGGLVPGASGPAPRLTREELIRDWDLDGDGSIGKSEADIARARMRRKRLEMQFGAGIDPVTGLPRGIDGGAETPEAEADDEPLFQLPPESPPGEPARTKPESLPGTRAPGPQPPVAGPQAPRPLSAATPGSQPAATAPPAPRSARASWLPPQRFAPAITGGVRAGAPPATSGYGAGTWSDLNAGRRPASIEPSAGGSTNASGGLLPSGRQPGRTGAMILPSLPGRPPGAAVPAPPGTGGTSRPRVTADEIGAERP